MEMINRAIPLAEGLACSDPSFDVANGCFDGIRDGVVDGVVVKGYVAGYCCCFGGKGLS